MKSLIQRILQSWLGFDTYLWWFTRYKLTVLHRDQSERDFFHFLSLMPADATVLDIGANLGLMTFYLAKRCKKVLAFEPMPHNLRVLERAARAFNWSNVDIHPIALGDTNGEVELILPQVDGVRKQGLSHVKHQKMEEFNEGELFKASIFKLDALDAVNGLKIDGIKIDVENFEYEVFKGGMDTIEQNRPVIYSELWDNQNRQDCFELLMGLGYTVKVLDKDTLVTYKPELHSTQNFFFIP